MITYMLQGLIIVLLIVFYFWLRPKMASMESIVNMYKGFGSDYAKWKTQHDAEYSKMEQQVSQLANEISEYKKQLHSKIATSDLEALIGRIDASVNAMRTFASILESIEQTLRFSPGKFGWLNQAFQANRVHEFVKAVKEKYDGLIKEGQEYLDSIGKKAE